ncbi:MAG: polysaccharide biosynthesis protein [Actinomycetota bacterium]
MRRDVPLTLLDVVCCLGAYLTPLVFRFEGAVPDRFWRGFWTLAPIIAVIHVTSNYVFGLYGQMWRYASVQEARRVVFAGASGGFMVVAAGAILGRGGRSLPLSVIGLGAVFSIMAFGAIRFQSRLFSVRRRSAMSEHKRVLLIGAGDAGAMLLRDILRNPSTGLEPVGLIDDDVTKVGRSLHGVPVLGTRSAIPGLVDKLRVDQVLLAIPSATSELVRDIAALSEESDVPLRVLPTVSETVGGRVSSRDLRELRIEDLLGRQQVESDFGAVRAIIEGRRVLITGAGGSIGSEIARQVMRFGPDEVVLLDHDETHLHDLVAEMGASEKLVTALADVRDFDRILSIFARHRPEIVFHAAAHKHVPMLENHPEEAVRTNVVGTGSVVDAAVATGVGRFVLISTDKAIRPVSVMGASKRIAEELVRTVQGRRVVFCAVRFGNVLGSRGSVIPTFLRQIARGGPVTVTDSSMTRYFMSVDEAVQLVLQAAALAEGGEVFTLDMGEPVNILDLARKVVRLSGHVPGKDIEITIIGPRPGEKLSEDIMDECEAVLPSGHPKIVVSRPPLPDPGTLRQSLRELEELIAHGDAARLSERLKAVADGALRTVEAGA